MIATNTKYDRNTLLKWREVAQCGPSTPGTTTLGFGPERGRDIVLQVDEHRFHVHSVIVRLYLVGNVFDTIVEQAFWQAPPEVKLFGDCPESWKLLLDGIYESATQSSLKTWEARTALAVTPLVHKYEGEKLRPGLLESLGSVASRSIRTPETAEELVRCEMSDALLTWFADNTWATTQNISIFLEALDAGSSETVCRRALEGAIQRLTTDELSVNSAEVTSSKQRLIRQIASLLPGFGGSARALAVEILMTQCSCCAWTPELAHLLTDAGHHSIAVAWFLHGDWGLDADRIRSFLEAPCHNDITLALIKRTYDAVEQAGRRWIISTESSLLMESRLSALLEHAVQLKQFEDQLMMVFDAVPSICRNHKMVEKLASAGFLGRAITWVKGMDETSLNGLIDRSCHIELVREACIQLRILVDSNRKKAQQNHASEIRTLNEQHESDRQKAKQSHSGHIRSLNEQHERAIQSLRGNCGDKGKEKGSFQIVYEKGFEKGFEKGKGKGKSALDMGKAATGTSSHQ